MDWFGVLKHRIGIDGWFWRFFWGSLNLQGTLVPSLAEILRDSLSEFPPTSISFHSFLIENLRAMNAKLGRLINSNVSICRSGFEIQLESKWREVGGRGRGRGLGIYSLDAICWAGIKEEEEKDKEEEEDFLFLISYRFRGFCWAFGERQTGAVAIEPQLI